MEFHANIVDQTLDSGGIRIVGKQQAQAGAKGNDLNIDIVDAIGLGNIVGDIQNQCLFRRVVITDLQITLCSAKGFPPQTQA